MPIIYKNSKRKKNVIKIHEKSVGIKHDYNKLIFFLIIIIILFISVGVVALGFASTHYHAYRGAYVVSVLFLDLVIFVPLFFLLILNIKTPYNVILYDTKLRKFKIYKNRYYQTITPDDIINMEIKKLFYSPKEKPYGYIIYEIKDITNLKTGNRFIKVLCENPKEVLENSREWIKSKMNEDYEKKMLTLKLQEKERQRREESRIRDLHVPKNYKPSTPVKAQKSEELKEENENRETIENEQN